MSSRCCLCCLTSLLCLTLGPPLRANTTTIALTGLSAAGIPSAEWGSLGPGTLNNSGALAFTGQLKPEANVISADNDAGVWLFDGSNTSLLAQTGSANVPGGGSADFASFDKATLSDSGEVAISGALVSGANGVTLENYLGIWRYSNSGDSSIVRTGSGNVAGVFGADFSGFPIAANANLFAQANNGQVTVFGSLAPGGGVLSSNDQGIWSSTASTSTLVAREGVFDVPNVGGENFNAFSLPSVNANNELVMLASLKTSSGVGANNASGVWRYSGSSGELLARSGSGDVPGVDGADFLNFGDPKLNDSGLVVVEAQLSNGDSGVWLYSTTTGTLLARTGTDNVPGVSSAKFNDFEVASMNNSGQVLVATDLELGPGDVTSGNNQGLWLLNGDPSLIARTGAGGVPGATGANFVSFASRALNEAGQVAFAADLQIGTGGVDSSNDSGIWIVDPNGNSTLVAREGELLAGRTIASLDFVGNGNSQSSGFNDLGQLAFQATFTDSASGLFLFQPLRADFDNDGDVDGVDLAQWQAAYGATTAADADGDGDTDGADFLIWQRELGSGIASLSTNTAVPEPTSGLLLTLGLLGMGNRRK